MVRGWWLVCLSAAACSGGVNGDDGGPNLGDGGSTAATAADTSAGPVTSSTATMSMGSVDATGTDPTSGDETSSPTSTTDPGSTGEPSCDAHWRVQPATSPLTDITYDATSDTIVAVGNDGPTGWAVALDACDGTQLAMMDLAEPGATTTYVRRAIATTEGLFVGGSVVTASDPGNGLYAALDPVTLAPLWSQTLVGGGDLEDEVLDMTLSTGGRVWMSGTANIGATPAPWTVSGSTMGMACGFSTGTPGAGSARAVVADGDTVVVAMRLDGGSGGLVLYAYDQACMCSCAPEWTSPTIDIGTGGTSVGDIVAVDGQYYVAGWAHDGVGVDLYGYVAWLNGSGTLLGTYTDDVTPTGEGITKMVAVGGTLYIGGGQAWDGSANFIGANARLQALSIPFAGSPSADWTTLPADLDIVEGMAATTEHVYVGGNGDGAAVVLRCDGAGDCG